MIEKGKINLQQQVSQNTQLDKFKRKITFLQLVLCHNSTIKAAAALSKINFATAKVILKKFRKFGSIKNSHQDYEKQIELLKEISSIKSVIKQEKLQKREQEFQMLSQKIKTIQPQNKKKELTNTNDVNFQLQVYQQELQQEKQKQFELVKSILMEQIKLMKQKFTYN
ncbi:unnamed protein product [Paramecium sonneborni]|uniref:Uncharacterized protein n=1 Tax=Paramecium sonneborni TaxID=65129 RepID=A0A8S1QLC0_9CILI|nr:unnamed protein product [Paramecium sonneborni]